MLVAITAVQVVLGELLPKTVALRYPEKMRGRKITRIHVQPSPSH